MSSRMEIPRLMARKSARSVSLRNGCAPRRRHRHVQCLSRCAHIRRRRRVGRRTGVERREEGCRHQQREDPRRKKKRMRGSASHRGHEAGFIGTYPIVRSVC